MGWTAADIPDQRGKVAVVTGANSGLGLEASRELARKGATVVMAMRNLRKGQQALAGIEHEIPNARLELRELDLGSLDSVRTFAGTVRNEHDAVDILLNNAGIMASPAAVTKDGFESQVGTNHLGHFVLTEELWPALRRAPSARVVTLTSVARNWGRALTESATWLDGSYDAWQAYSDSKLANFHFGMELARRLEAAASSVSSLVAHPGLSNTNLMATTVQNGGGGLLGRLLQLMGRVVGMSAADGARPQLRAATDPHARNGGFYGPRWTMVGAPIPLKVSEGSAPAALTDRMWRISEARTQTTFSLDEAP